MAAALAGATHILVTISQGEGGDPVLALHGDDISRRGDLAWIGYLSTVGVYGDHGGAWIDEETPPDPRWRGPRRGSRWKRHWTRLGRRRDVPVGIFRLAGIYGPGRNPFVKLAEGSAHRIVKPGQVFNRIHVADIAATLRAGIARPAARLYNVADDEPAPPQDVVAYAAGLMGVAPPPEVPFAEADLSPMARSFYEGNRRVSNRRIREELGVSLAYPTSATGFRAVARRDLAGLTATRAVRPRCGSEATQPPQDDSGSDLPPPRTALFRDPCRNSAASRLMTPGRDAVTVARPRS